LSAVLAKLPLCPKQKKGKKKKKKKPKKKKKKKKKKTEKKKHHSRLSQVFFQAHPRRHVPHRPAY